MKSLKSFFVAAIACCFATGSAFAVAEHEKGVDHSLVVTVNYQLSLKQMLEKGAFDDVNPYLNEANFAIEKGPLSVRVELVSLDFGEGLVNSLEAGKALLNKPGYRPATLAETVALVSQYPTLLTGMTIVAPGTIYVVPTAGHKAVAAFRGFMTKRGDNVRIADTCGAGVTCFRDTNVLFAVVKK